MAFHVLAKPTGAICNLDCTYCFFLSKESLYPGSPFRMADDLLELYLRQMIESQAVPEVTIAWQGGEPTMMGLDFFRQAFALVERLKPPGMQVEHTIQTNGTLLDEEWCDFFREHGVLVGLSMAGPAEMHDTFRVDKGGKPTHERVEAAAQLMQERGVEFNKALILTGSFAAQSAADLETMAARLDSATSATAGKASEVLSLVASSGRFTAEQIELVAQQAEQLLVQLLCGFFTKFIRFHHITVRLTKEVASGSFAAARAKASRASSSETPSISYRTLPG